jgi:hypothetical protein
LYLKFTKKLQKDKLEIRLTTTTTTTTTTDAITTTTTATTILRAKNKDSLR